VKKSFDYEICIPNPIFEVCMISLWGNFYQFLLLSLFFAPPIFAHENQYKLPEETVEKCLEIVIFDGSNNCYLLRRNNNEPLFELEYRPIARMQSSSFVYDGGTAKETNVSNAEFKKIFEMSMKLLHCNEFHKKTREMGTCMLKIKFISKQQKAIIARNDNLQSLLHELKHFIDREK